MKKTFKEFFGKKKSSADKLADRAEYHKKKRDKFLHDHETSAASPRSLIKALKHHDEYEKYKALANKRSKSHMGESMDHDNNVAEETLYEHDFEIGSMVQVKDTGKKGKVVKIDNYGEDDEVYHVNFDGEIQKYRPDSLSEACDDSDKKKKKLAQAPEGFPADVSGVTEDTINETWPPRGVGKLPHGVGELPKPRKRTKRQIDAEHHEIHAEYHKKNMEHHKSQLAHAKEHKMNSEFTKNHEKEYAKSKEAYEWHAEQKRKTGIFPAKKKNAKQIKESVAESMDHDMEFANKSLKEEEQAVKDYTDRIARSKCPELKKILKHALEEEKHHAKLFKEWVGKNK